MAFKIVEDRPTPKEVYNWRIYLFAVTVCMGAMVFGYDGAFFGTTYARASFQRDFGPLDTNASANLTASFLAAAFFGALSAWPVMETLGRRWVVRIHAVVFCVGAIIMTVPGVGQVGMIYAGRAITGFAAGALTAVVPTYVAESSPPPIRGQLTGMFEIAYQAGAVVGFWINYGINQTLNSADSVTWKIPMAVQLIPGGLLLLFSIFILESPAFLIRKGRDEQALKNLSYLRMLPADHVYIQEEVGFVKARMEEELEMSRGESGMSGYLKGAFRELKAKHMRHRLAVTFGMFFFQNWSGAAVINYYSPKLFTALGIKDVALYTGIYGLVKAIGSFIFFAWLVDRSGRRVPWLISASACSFFLLYLAIFIKVSTPGNPGPAGNVAIAFVMLYSLFWSFGGNGLPWIVSSEIFPTKLRSLTGSFAACTQWAVSFAATQAFPYMTASPMGTWGCFLLYSIACALTFVFTFIWVPETKGIPIESMQSLFEGPVRHAAWRQKQVYPPDGLPPIPQNLLAHDHGKLPHDSELGDEKYATEYVDKV